MRSFAPKHPMNGFPLSGLFWAADDVSRIHHVLLILFGTSSGFCSER